MQKGLSLNRRKLFLSSLILGAEAAIYYLKYFYAYVVFGYHRYLSIDPDVRALLIQATDIVLCLLLSFLICRAQPRQWMHYLGLDKNPLIPLLLALICTLPMFIGFGYYSGFQVDHSIQADLLTSMWAGFNEELIFRSFLAGLLMRKAGWSFLPAAIVSGLAFGAGHLYQASGSTQGWMIFGFTLLVHIGFFALYKFWDWNLWFVVFLHGFMDLSFSLFTPAENVLLNGPANVFRGITILMAIAITAFRWIRKLKKERFALVSSQE
jgi:membrane protease YdiL (CAAX protease family)